MSNKDIVIEDQVAQDQFPIDKEVFTYIGRHKRKAIIKNRFKDKSVEMYLLDFGGGDAKIWMLRNLILES